MSYAQGEANKAIRQAQGEHGPSITGSPEDKCVETQTCLILPMGQERPQQALSSLTFNYPVIL